MLEFIRFIGHLGQKENVRKIKLRQAVLPNTTLVKHTGENPKNDESVTVHVCITDKKQGKERDVLERDTPIIARKSPHPPQDAS